MSISPLPDPPQTTDPHNFAVKADALLAALPPFVTQANAQAAAMNLNSTTDTSASSVLIGTGAKNFTVSAGKSFQPGMYLVLADSAAPSSNSVFGQVTSYDVVTGALVMSVQSVRGSGTKTSWVASQSSAGGAAAGANGDITGLSALASVNGGQLAGFRNVVINGNGLVQLMAAPTLTAALQYGAAEGHLVGVTSGTSLSGTVGVLANTGFSCGVGYGAIAASWTTGQFIHKNRIEGANTKQLNGKTVTVSGKIYQDTGGSRNFTVSLGKPTTTLDTFSAVTNLGTSGAVAVPSGVVTPFTYTLALGSTDASLGLEALITDNAANTVVTKNYAISDLQLEIGSVASTFEQRSIATETALCQRYYETMDARHFSQEFYSTGGLGVHVSQGFKVVKRVTPTVTEGSISSQANSSGRVATGTTTGFELTWSPASGLAYLLYTAGSLFTASARL